MAEDRFELLSQKNSKDTSNDVKPKKKPLYKRLGEPKKEDIFESLALQQVEEKKEKEGRSLYDAFIRGGKSGVGGLIAGYEPEAPPEDEGWGEYLASLTGSLISDAPGFYAGGQAGALAGGALGSVLPGAGTAAGAGLGATIGAFALPSFIKSSFGEYRDYAAKGGDLSFGDFLERSGRIAKETGKAGVMGAAMAGAGRFLPIMKRIPALKKILSTKLGAGIAGGAIEAGTLTGTRSVIEGKLPTAKEVVGDVFTVGAMKGVQKGREAFGRYAKRPLVKPEPKAAKAAKVKGTPKKVVKEIKAEDWGDRAEARVNKKNNVIQKAKDTIGKYSNVGIKKIQEVRGKVIQKARPLIENKFIDAAKKFLPESIQRELNAESRLKSAKWEEKLKEYVGSKNAETVRSAFEWQEKQVKYEKSGGEFTKQQLEEMMYYAQKTGNANKGIKDSFADLSERLPSHAKKFVEEVVRPHLNESLEAWNENSATKNINPRDGLEEYYLPGLYEKASKTKLHSVGQNIQTKFGIKNPFSSTKKFLTYNEAAIKAGLKPRFTNIVDLMRYFDKVNIKMMHNAELVESVEKFQKETGDQIIVTANNPKEYAKAHKDGFIPFEDPFLRRYRGKEGSFERTELPALVQPEFADSFKGVFSRKAFRPDGNFLKGLDWTKRQINGLRVMASPFHFVAEMESVLGQRGIKGFRLMNMASEGRALRSNKEFMMDAARHGLVLKKRLGIPELRKGNMLLERGLDLIIDSKSSPKLIKKGVAKIKRAFTYLFDEFIPNAKAVTAKESLTRELKDFKSEHKRQPTHKELTDIKRTVYEHMNNIFGGQNWETSKYLRDPQVRKRISRILAFPDWTISALKQAQSVGKSGLAGKMGIRYAMKYTIYGSAVAAFLRALFGGLEQIDDEKQSVKGIRFNLEKAARAAADVKSHKDLFSFALPDTPLRYGPGDKQVFNPGRDEKGVIRKAHFGKQQFEITEGWLQHPMSTLYSKANPVPVILYEQITGARPTRYGMWTIDKGRFRGREQPWQGKRGLWAQKWSRLNHILVNLTPFALRNGAEQWISTAFGSVPVAKQYSPFKAEDDMEKALLITDKKKSKEALAGIKALLLANKFEEKTIKSRITTVRNQLIKDGQLPEALTLKRAEPRIRKYLLGKNVKELNDLKKELMETEAYTKKGIRNNISKVRNILINEGKLPGKKKKK